MARVEMSLHQALAELKRLDDRIKNSLKADFVLPNRKGNSKIGSSTVEEKTNEIKGNFQRTEALITNRRRIKNAIIKANAETTFTIDGDSYTIAEAIELKNSIGLDYDFLSALKGQYITSKAKVEAENEALQPKLENYLKSILGDNDKKDQNLVKSYTETFFKTNEWQLIDPKRIAKYIEDYGEKISKFETEVDYKLSEINSKTTITVDLFD